MTPERRFSHKCEYPIGEMAWRSNDILQGGGYGIHVSFPV
jgi:hypothetical protein